MPQVNLTPTQVEHLIRFLQAQDLSYESVLRGLLRKLLLARDAYSARARGLQTPAPTPAPPDGGASVLVKSEAVDECVPREVRRHVIHDSEARVDDGNEMVVAEQVSRSTLRAN